MAALLFTKRRRMSVLIPAGSGSAPEEVDEEEYSAPPGTLIDPLHTPVEISAATLLGTMPRKEYILFDDILEKVTPNHSWKAMRVVLTTIDIRIARPDENGVRDCIPLTEILEIRTSNSLPVAGDITFTPGKVQGGNENDPQEDKIYLIQIETVPDGFNSGRTYYFKAQTLERAKEWISMVKTAIDNEAKSLRANMSMARRAQRRLRIIYNSIWVQSCVGLLIFISFAVNIVQTELLFPPDSEQQRRADVIFGWFEVVITSIFAFEVAVNLFANWLQPFFTDPWSVRRCARRDHAP